MSGVKTTCIFFLAELILSSWIMLINAVKTFFLYSVWSNPIDVTFTCPNSLQYVFTVMEKQFKIRYQNWHLVEKS